ncbi:Signal transduction regulator containing Rec and PAS domain [Methanonatronarchaeum thermophilum]|uniref:Signal transduction regulator containing Rec and PAS domain n=1 Tax=Methanonatronarchaeum thermophilum TaxID=1927129 RepID=A0A1Y3GFA6_9EURY|nr:PAS domain-containing protein [Methanonatronarchaeum thermophilum]OUJ18145.1 Signal transduction regulator containing Rec and PAS domain [Methanonatronarchaeum thermophilum]
MKFHESLVLFISKDRGYSRSFRSGINDQFSFDVSVVGLNDFIERSDIDFDAIVFDYSSYDDFNVVEKVCRKLDEDTPFLVITDEFIDEDFVRALDLNVDRFIKRSIVKNNIEYLYKAIEYEVQEFFSKKKSEELARDFRKSNKRFVEIFDELKSFVGVLDSDGVLISINKSAMELINADKREVEGRLFWNTPWWFHSKEVQEEIQKCIKQAVDTGACEFEVSRVGNKTRDYYFTLKPIQGSNEGLPLLFIEGKDITKQKKREKEYHKLINNLNDIVLINEIKEPYRIIQVNETAVEKLEYTQDELLMMRTLDLEMPEYAKSMDNRMKELQKKKSIVFKTVIITKEGNKIPFEISSNLIKYRDRLVSLNIMRDISNRIETEQKVEFFNSLLLNVFKDKIDLSHKYLNILSDQNISELESEFIVSTKDNIKEIKTLIDDIAPVFSETNYQNTEFSLIRLFKESLNKNQEEITSRRVKVHVECNDHMIKTNKLTTELFSNLLRISVNTSKSRNILIKDIKDSEGVKIMYEDDGLEYDLTNDDYWNLNLEGKKDIRLYLIRKISELNDIKIIEEPSKGLYGNKYIIKFPK